MNLGILINIKGNDQLGISTFEICPVCVKALDVALNR